MDRMRALETFIQIADRGSLVGAARSLSISAPSVTRVLNELEESLGVLLFHRTTRAVVLTDTGQAFLADARRIVAEFEEATELAKGAHCAPKGVLRVTASSLFGQHYISPIILEYLDLYPDVSVEAVYLDRLVNVVEEGFDIAVRIGPLADSSLMATRVGAVKRVVCGCRSYFDKAGLPQKPGDLKDHRIIHSSAVAPTNDWRFKDGEVVTVTPRLRFQAVTPAIEAAKTGWGLTRVLSYQIGPDLGSGDLMTILSGYEPEELPIHIVHPEGRSASAKVRAFVDLARKHIRGNKFLNT
jgi:DNA-binding transcriptional LysR family regulator